MSRKFVRKDSLEMSMEGSTERKKETDKSKLLDYGKLLSLLEGVCRQKWRELRGYSDKDE